MTVFELGAIGEFIGAIAVVVTLVYLTVQLRQNTNALRSNSWQAIQDAEQRFDMLLASDAKLMEIWARGLTTGLASLDDPVERSQFHSVGKQLIDLYQTHHYQYETGMIDVDLWSTWVTQYDESMTNTPGFRDVVKARYRHLRPSFRQFVDAHPYVVDS